MLLDAWRLAVGTLTAVPVSPPRAVDTSRARLALLLAPPATAPLGLLVAGLLAAGHAVGLAPAVVALLAVGAVALGTRGMHLDGLSDVADGLAASYDRERALTVMKSGTSGPAGTVAVFVVLGLQTAGLAGLASSPGGWRAAVLAGVVVCASRAAVLWCGLRGVGPARADGLGRPFTETIPLGLAALVWVAVAALVALVGAWAGLPWWRGAVATVAAALAVGAVVGCAVRRFGGVTGDVFGAAIEAGLAAMLGALS